MARVKKKPPSYKRSSHQALFTKEERKMLAKQNIKDNQQNLAMKNKNSGRAAAVAEVKRLIAEGKLVKTLCGECGSTINLYAYFKDNSKPLEAEWYCPPHYNLKKKGKL